MAHQSGGSICTCLTNRLAHLQRALCDELQPFKCVLLRDDLYYHFSRHDSGRISEVTHFSFLTFLILRFCSKVRTISQDSPVIPRNEFPVNFYNILSRNVLRRQPGSSSEHNVTSLPSIALVQIRTISISTISLAVQELTSEQRFPNNRLTPPAIRILTLPSPFRVQELSPASASSTAHSVRTIKSTLGS